MRKNFCFRRMFATAVPAVGSVVPHAEGGVGAIATQANTEISYGIRGLQLLKMGFSPQTALEAMLKEDKNRETRQVTIIDKNGKTALSQARKQSIGKVTLLERMLELHNFSSTRDLPKRIII